jgi:hypothetical protein
MSLSNKLQTLSRCITNLVRNPRESVRTLAYPQPYFAMLGSEYARQWEATTNGPILKSATTVRAQENYPNPLETYFDGIREGPGVWKARHYFELYHRHLRKFVGRDVTVVEVGIYSGGSMLMWRHYFGEGCRVHGVDIQKECKAYEDSHTTIHIGDQGDRGFWKRFREAVPSVDVFIDDGSHDPVHQIVTLEEILEHLRPGGVYICEDVCRIGSPFMEYVHSLADELNAGIGYAYDGQEISYTPTPLQAAVNSVHLYPFVAVIEKRDTPLKRISALKHGTKWEPFGDKWEPFLQRHS